MPLCPVNWSNRSNRYSRIPLVHSQPQNNVNLLSDVSFFVKKHQVVIINPKHFVNILRFLLVNSAFSWSLAYERYFLKLLATALYKFASVLLINIRLMSWTEASGQYLLKSYQDLQCCVDRAGLCNRVALCTIHAILVLKLDKLLLLVDKNIGSQVC